MRRGERRPRFAGEAKGWRRVFPGSGARAMGAAPVRLLAGRVLASRLRRWLPDRNPLRRASDRIEAGVLAGLLAAFLAGAPLAALAAGQWAGAAGLRAERAQAAWHQVPAVLLANAGGPAQPRSQASLEQPVPARWTAPDGTVHTGTVDAPPGARAGTRLLVWTDGSGHLTPAAVHPSDVAGRIAEAAGGAVVAVALVLAGLGLVARRILDRRRLNLWDARWVVIEPQWSGRA